MVNVKRKKGESFESLLRRFSRRVQASGKILQVKKIRFHQDIPSQTTLKKSALRRLSAAEKRDYLLKTGRLVETETAPRRRG